MPYSTALTTAAVLLGAICAISLLPLAVLYLEFSGFTFCHGPYWAYIARFYGSYFLFPIFGILAAVFALRPFAAIGLILSQPQMKRIFQLALGGAIALVTIVSILEFTGSPNALFEVAPAALQNGAGKTFFDNFQTACNGPRFAYAGNYDGNQPGTDKDKSFQSQLGEAKKAGLSYSHYVYYLVLPVQAGLHSLLLTCFFVLIYLRKPFVDVFLSDRKLYFDKNNIFVLFGIALIVGSLWCLYRTSYRIDNDDLFGAHNNPLYDDQIVIYLYFAVVTVYIIWAGFDLEKIAKTASQVAAAVAVMGLSLNASKVITDNLFGLDASIQNFVGVFVLILVLISIGLIFNNPSPPPPPVEPEDG